MENSPELNGKYLGTITKDFVNVANVLKEASYQLRMRKISAHPIFALSKEHLPLGKLLIAKEEMNLQWNYYFTYLDDLRGRNVIEEERVEDFKQTYRDPDEYCCLFVVDQDFVNFVYIPFPEDLTAEVSF